MMWIPTSYSSSIPGYWSHLQAPSSVMHVGNMESYSGSPTSQGVYQPVRTARGQSSYKCPNCSRFYMRASCLKRHLRVECGQTPKFQCRICQGWFKYKHNLAAHMKLHVEEPKHHCVLCPKKFYRRDKLVEHERKCHNVLTKSNQSDGNF